MPNILFEFRSFFYQSARILIKVDLPAPLGPNNPKIEPFYLRETLSRAVFFDYLPINFFKFLI